MKPEQLEFIEEIFESDGRLCRDDIRQLIAEVRALTAKLHDLTDDETFCGHQRRYQYIKDAHCVPGPAESCSLCAIADLTRQRDEAQAALRCGICGLEYDGHAHSGHPYPPKTTQWAIDRTAELEAQLTHLAARNTWLESEVKRLVEEAQQLTSALAALSEKWHASSHIAGGRSREARELDALRERFK